MRHRRRQRNMAHAVTPDARQRDFDAAFLADDALVFHALVLAAQAFVILDRPEDAGAEQAVALRLEGPVVDRLRLLDLAEGPGPDALGACDRDLDLIEALSSGGLTEGGDEFVVHCMLPNRILIGAGGINSCAARVRRSGRATGVPS